MQAHRLVTSSQRGVVLRVSSALLVAGLSFLPSCRRASDANAPWATVMIRNDITSINQPFTYYYRWSSQSPWQHASLRPGETAQYRERCDAECQDGLYFQAQFDCLGYEAMERGRYYLQCYLSPTGAESDSPLYHIRLSGTNPIIKEERGSPTARGAYYPTDGPVDSFVHPALMTMPSRGARGDRKEKQRTQ